MATADISIYGKNPLRSVADFESDMNAVDLQRDQLRRNQLDFADRPIKAAREAEKALVALEQEKAQTAGMRVTAQQTAVETAGKVAARYKDALPNVTNPQQLAAWYAQQYADPILSPVMNQTHGPLLKTLSEIPDDPAQFEAMKMKIALGMKGYVEAEEKKATLAQTIANATRQAAHQEATLAATRSRDAETGRHNLATEANQRATRAAADTQAKAPTLGDVVDPADPTRMLKIDARVYKGGSLGSPGVFGVAGKEPGAAVRETKEAAKAETKNEGARQADDIITALSGYYDVLEKEGAITSTKKGAIPNVGAYIGSTGPGQVVGSMVGTRAQSARDSIAQTRPVLLNAIKTATGMSAQQLNSNAELKLWLDAATDPKKSLESNREALANLSKWVGGNSGAGGPPAGIDPKDWAHMTPDERKLWQKK